MELQMAVVNYDIDGDIAVMTVDNPPVNVLSFTVRAGLYEGVTRAEADDRVKATVIVCAGRSFVAGADITEFGTPRAVQEPRLRHVQSAIEGGRKPGVAA